MNNYALDKVKKFIDLLGYRLEESGNDVIILDDNNKRVGFIRYCDDKVGYYIYINSNNIFYEEYCPTNCNMDYPYFRYDFLIKRKKSSDRVQLNIGDYPWLIIKSSKHGNIIFETDFEGMNFDYTTKIGNTMIHEKVSYKNNHDSKSEKKMFYYLDSNAKGHNMGRALSFSYNPFINDYDEVDCSMLSWVDKKNTFVNKSVLEGNVSSKTIESGLAIESFNRLRLLVKHILPFKKDVFLSSFSNNTLEELELYPFFCNYEVVLQDILSKKM